MSPHFKLMDESAMPPAEAMLLRSKLHWRCGLRRMEEKKSSAGITTLYDALLSAMRWYILTHLHNEIGEEPEEKLENDRFVFFLMKKAGILDRSFDLQLLEEVVDKALMEEDFQEDQDKVVQQLEQLLTRLGLLPFDVSKLPPEDPATF